METEIRTNVIKRNGEEVIFDKSKIINAIKKANEEVPKIHQLSEFQIMAVAETVASRALAASHAVNAGLKGSELLVQVREFHPVVHSYHIW